MRLAGSEIFSAGLAFVAMRVPSAAFYQMDARNIPFRDEFDIIGAFDVLEHIEDDVAVIDQVAKALRPGGGSSPPFPSIPPCGARRTSTRRMSAATPRESFAARWRRPGSRSCV